MGIRDLAVCAHTHGGPHLILKDFLSLFLFLICKESVSREISRLSLSLEKSPGRGIYRYLWRVSGAEQEYSVSKAKVKHS